MPVAQERELLDALRRVVDLAADENRRPGSSPALLLGLVLRRPVSGAPWAYHLSNIGDAATVRPNDLEVRVRQWALRAHAGDSIDEPLAGKVKEPETHPRLYAMCVPTGAEELAHVTAWCVTETPSRTGLYPLLVRSLANRSRYVVRRKLLRLSTVDRIAEACLVHQLRDALQVIVEVAAANSGILWRFDQQRSRYVSVTSVGITSDGSAPLSYNVPMALSATALRRTGIVGQIRPESPVVRFDNRDRSMWVPQFSGEWHPRDQKTFSKAGWRSCIGWAIDGGGYLLGATTLYSTRAATALAVPSLRAIFDASVSNVLRLQEQEQKLAQAESAFNQELSRSAVSLSVIGHVHDISRAIRRVKSSVTEAQGFLEARPPAIVETREALDIAAEHCEFVGSLADQLRRLSLEVDWRTTVFDVGKVLRDLAPFLSEQARSISNATLRLSVSELTKDFSLRIHGNPLKLERAIFNIVDNAAYWTRGVKGASIRITVEPGNSKLRHDLRIRIADNGRGIEPSDRPKVFDRFFTRRPKEGSGLGLYLAKQFVTEMGGRISVASEVGRGSEFTIEIATEE